MTNPARQRFAVVTEQGQSIGVLLKEQRGKRQVRIGRLYVQRGIWETELGPVLAGLGYVIVLSDGTAQQVGGGPPEGVGGESSAIPHRYPLPTRLGPPEQSDRLPAFTNPHIKLIKVSTPLVFPPDWTDV